MLQDHGYKASASHGVPVHAPAFAWWQGHMGVNNLPGVVAQPHPGSGSNSRPLDRNSDALPLCHHATYHFTFPVNALKKQRHVPHYYYYFASAAVTVVTSVLWRWWLGVRKGIRPVKNWVVRCWHGYLSAARCRLAYGPADAIATHCLLIQWNPDWFYLSGTGSPE